MATVNELLAGIATVDKSLVISNDFRTINIPSSVPNLGVEYDDDVLKLDFKMPRYVSDTDLSTFSIRINYINSKGESDAYTVRNAVVGSEYITFSWLVGPTATRYKGDTKFNICAKIVTPDGIVDREFNTTIATLPVLEGLEVEESIVTEYSDIIEQWKRELFGIGDTEEASIKAVSQAEQKAITDEGARVLATIPADYATAVSMTDNADRTKSDAIVSTRQGASIIVSDSSDDYVRGLKIFGKTTQATTTGKQLININQKTKTNNGIVFTPNPDGSVHVKGTATANAYFIFDSNNSIPVMETELVASISGSDQVYMVVGYFTGDGTVVNSIASVDDKTTSTFTYPATAATTRTFLGVDTGKSVDATVYPLVRLASDPDDSYEPYSGGVASPSPKWPQELKSIESPTVNIYGANLLTDYTGYKMTQRGITCEFEGDGVYHIYGTFSGTNPSIQFADLALNIPVDPDAEYTMSGELISGTLPDDYHPYMGLSSETVNHRNWMALSIDNRHKVGDIVTSTMIPSDTLNNATHINKFWIYAHNDNLEPYTIDCRIRVWLTKSDSLMPYEPYTRQKLTVVNTLNAIPVSQNGNYADENDQQWICDEIDFERGVYVQRVGSKLFDGSSDEIWYYESLVLDNTVMFRIEISDSVNVGNIVGKDYLCSNFQVKNMYNVDVEGTQHTMQQFYFRINKSTLATADIGGFRAYLAEHPMTVQYVLATPIETPLTQEEIEWFRFAHTNFPNTTVLNDAGAILELKYNADTKTYLEDCFRPTDEQVQDSVETWLEDNHERLPAGEPGYTPVKGKDYWTDADKEEIKSYVDKASASGIINEVKGNPITLKDSSNRELQGLKLFNKNLLPLNEITFTGTYYYHLEKPIPAGNYYFYVGNITTTSTNNNCLIAFVNNETRVAAFQRETTNTNNVPLYVSSDITDIYFYASKDHENSKEQTATYKDIMISVDGGAYAPYFGGGDVTVKVMGKNLLEINEVTFNGTYSVELEKPIPAGNYKFYTGGITITNTSATCRIGFYSNGTEIQAIQVEKIAGYTNLTLAAPVTKIYFYAGTSYSNAEGHEATFKDLMISVDGGDFEPYQEPQPLVVSVPNGLGSDGFVCENCAELHTYKPNTTITNDVGAIMEVEYVADTKAYIDNKFNELAAAIVNNA